MSWRAEWTARARKDLDRLDRRTRDRIVSAVETLARTGQGDVRHLKGKFAGTYRLRVGEWRVFFLRESERMVLLVLRVLPRSGAYE